MQKLTHEIYSFDEFRLDLTRGFLFRGTDEINLRPKSFEVLRYLAKNSGRLVTKDELIDYVWQGNAVTDDSLVQCLKDIRTALADKGHTYIRTVPRRGYIFEKEVTENGPTIYEEETTDVRLVIEEMSESAGIRVLSGRYGIGGIIGRHKIISAAVLAVLLTLVGGTAFFSSSILAWMLKPPSIAVLRINNETGDAGQDYISDGLTESIIMSLLQLKPRLRVLPRETVFLLKNKEFDPRAAGSQLGVDSVLGSKMFLQNGMRFFKFELINVADGAVLWSTQYSVPGHTFGRGTYGNEEFLVMQNKIPNDVAAQLQLGLNDAERQILTRRYTQNPEAYDLYLKGRAEFRLATPSSLRKSIEYFEQAIALDANFATAYWAMGMSYRTQGLIDERPDKEANERAAVLFRDALRIDNTLAPAINAIKWTDLDQRDWKKIEDGGRDHPAYGAFLVASGRINEQIKFEKAQLSLDPLWPTGNLNHCWTLITARRYDDAIAQCQKTLNLSVDGKARFGPNSPWAHLQLANAYCQKGMFTESIAEIKLAIEKAEDSEAMWAVLGYIYAKAGQRDEAIKILNFLNERISQGEYVPALNVAWIYAEIGEKDQAFFWFNKAIDEGEDRLLNMKFEQEMDGMRDDPRFPEMIRRIGLPN